MQPLSLSTAYGLNYSDMTIVLDHRWSIVLSQCGLTVCPLNLALQQQQQQEKTQPYFAHTQKIKSRQMHAHAHAHTHQHTHTTAACTWCI